MDTILLIDDDAGMQYSFRRLFEGPDLRLHTASSGEEGLQLLPEIKPDLVILDIRMGGMGGLETLRRLRQSDGRLPVIMITAHGTTQTAIEAMKRGAFDYLLKPFDVPRLKQIVAAALQAARDMKRVVALEPHADADEVETGIVGRCEAMQSVFKLIGQLADADATVLITGESGTGKELVARAIYQNSRRSQRPFLAINCAAIPETLLESELFGHEKGAFTGAATQRIGRFEQCHGGTLFLDEIGDMSLTTQTKILRVLQDGTFERLGGNTPVSVDVRIIAATNHRLEQAVTARRFREDLFYRLNVVRIPLPPLRERRGDVRLLVQYFMRTMARTQGKPLRSIAPDALAALERYSWPGNVRELENALERAGVVAKGDVVRLSDLPPEVQGVAAATANRGSAPGGEFTDAATDVAELAAALFARARRDPKLRVLPAVERVLVLEALKETRGNQVQAARLLGITRATLRKRMDKFAIRSELKFE
ncbi:MAG TPA: sigma-54 dependent transcriptional regulator [Verrucomicrobiota bacterium]|nr:sigma-54 dependent transcriptional regulator [Verrucomicrobiota bacterium]HNU49478.1 sigma-54 dependent transcriptional regulator [Verrucomicrobiota bacterium]